MRWLLIVLLLSAAPALAQSPATLSLKVGARQQLQVTRKAGDAPNWISSDPTVVSVINSASPALDGTVIARRPGSVTVTAMTLREKFETKVTVTDK